MAVVGRHRAAADKAQPVTGALDHAPAGAPEPWIDADNANRSRHAKITIPRHHCTVATEAVRDHVVSNQVVSCRFKVMAPVASATDDRRETGAGDRTTSKMACRKFRSRLPAAAVVVSIAILPAVSS